METKKINWKQALDLLNEGVEIQQDEIEFDETVHIHNVIVFNKNGIEVPEHLIDFDDENIDCSDAPEITTEDIETGKLVRILPMQIKVAPEIHEWILNSNIDCEELLSNLLKGFYQALQSLSK